MAANDGIALSEYGMGPPPSTWTINHADFNLYAAAAMAPDPHAEFLGIGSSYYPNAEYRLGDRTYGFAAITDPKTQKVKTIKIVPVDSPFKGLLEKLGLPRKLLTSNLQSKMHVDDFDGHPIGI